MRPFFGWNYRMLAQNKGNTFKKSAHLDTVRGRDTTQREELDIQTQFYK